MLTEANNNTNTSWQNSIEDRCERGKYFLQASHESCCKGEFLKYWISILMKYQIKMFTSREIFQGAWTNFKSQKLM